MCSLLSKSECLNIRSIKRRGDLEYYVIYQKYQNEKQKNEIIYNISDKIYNKNRFLEIF